MLLKNGIFADLYDCILTDLSQLILFLAEAAISAILQ